MGKVLLNMEAKALKRSLLAISDRAAEQIKLLLKDRDSLGIRVKVKSGGCSGLSYVIEYADDTQPFEEIVEDKGVRVLIDPKAVMYLIGTEMDYVTEMFKSGFVFKNPNEKGRCGCGKSFHI